MEHSTEPGSGRLRVRDLRMRQGLSMAGLAEAAGLDLRTVRCVEADPESANVQLNTLHSLARVLGVPTGSLFTAPHPDPIPVRRDVHALRVLIEPPPAPPEPPSRDALAALLREAEVCVQDNDILNALPAVALLVPHARVAVETATGAGALREARSVLVRGYDYMATMLTLVGESQLAMAAADHLEQVAHDEGDQVWAAAAAAARAWPMMRQGSFRETITLVEAAAAEIEPDIKDRDVERVAMWGTLMRWISGSAARNNQPELAADATRRAGVAAALLGGDQIVSGHATGPTMVAIRALENAVVTEDFGRATKLLRRFPRDGKVLPRDRQRHALDVADIALENRHPDRALSILSQIREEAPAWLESQPVAVAIGAKLVKSAKRRLSPEVRDLADFLHVPA